MLKVTPRQIREEIDVIAQDLAELEPWEKKLVDMRKRYVLCNERDVVDIIENGLRGGQGRPALADLDPFDEGKPGLHETRRELAELKERRELLTKELPSKAENAKSSAQAQVKADDICTRATDLAARARSVDAVLTELARIALPFAEDLRGVWEDNAALDKLAFDNDIVRPPTPRPDAPLFDLAAPLSALLRLFLGQDPSPVDPDLAGRIRASSDAERNVDKRPLTVEMAAR